MMVDDRCERRQTRARARQAASLHNWKIVTQLCQFLSLHVSAMAGGAAEDTPARPEGKAGATDTPNNAGRTSNRKRKQADFYNPGEGRATEKLVIKEVCAHPST